LRAAWRTLVAGAIDARRLVFVDEMAAHTSLSVLYAYSPRGRRIHAEVPRNRGKNTTLLASITIDGMGPCVAVEEIVRYIPEALDEEREERIEDFAYMVDTLTRMRLPYHPATNYLDIERVAAFVLCWLVRIKPAAYIAAMKDFRILFRGIAEDRQLQATFRNSVLPATLVAQLEEIEPIPSLYFTPVPILSYMLNEPLASITDVDGLENQLYESLPNWPQRLPA